MVKAPRLFHNNVQQSAIQNQAWVQVQPIKTKPAFKFKRHTTHASYLNVIKF